MLLLSLAEAQMGKRRVVVDDWADHRPDIRQMTCYRGQHSIFQLAGPRSVRWCDGSVSAEVGGAYFPSLYIGELRTAYLRSCGAGATRWDSTDVAACNEVAQDAVPGWVTAPGTEPLVQLDGVKTYLQWMIKFSSQVIYNAGTGVWAPIGEPWRDVAELRRHKELYSSICTRTWRSPTRTLWRRGVPEEQRSTYFYQPQAWRLLSDIMHAQAQEAVAMWDVKRVMADAYWVPESRATEFELFMAERWGFEMQVKDRWEPGEPWPQMEACSIRVQDDAKRQALAWRLAGNGPMAGRPIAFTKGARVYLTGERTPPVPPTPTSFDRAQGRDPQVPLHCPVMPQPYNPRRRPRPNLRAVGFCPRPIAVRPEEVVLWIAGRRIAREGDGAALAN